LINASILYYNKYINERESETMFEIPEVKLSYKQKLILEVLQDEFHGEAFGPQMLKESENEDLRKLTINEITWHMLRLRDAALVSSQKKNYEGRVLNCYATTEYIRLDAVKIK
jgi:DNA-binding transcriptional ArsR family regulator